MEERAMKTVEHFIITDCCAEFVLCGLSDAAK